MGKGARKRGAREEKRIKELEIEKRRQKERTTRRVFRITVTSLIALVIISGVVLSTLFANGFFLRNTVSVTAPSYNIDNAMMSYYYHNQLNSYSSYFQYFGVDTSKSLKEQQYSEEQTWFEFLMDSAKTTVKEMVLVSEAAKEAGVSLDEKDVKTIEKTLTSIKNAAKKNNLSYDKYLDAKYGKGVRESDVKKCLELSTLYNKYKKQILDKLVYSDNDIQAYYTGNNKQFQYFDFKSYTFKSDIPDGSTEEQTKTINTETKKKADELAARKTPDSFDAYLTQYLKTSSDVEEDKIPETIKGTLTEASTYSEGSDLSDWAYASNRAVGDTTVLEGTNQYTVYLLVKAPYRKEYITKNIRHILLTADTYGSLDKAKTKAEELKNEWLKGEKSPASFGILANDNSEDSGSNTAGGLYKNIMKGDMVDAFDAWAYNEARKAGDIDIISTDYGVHVIYFESNGQEAWKAEVLEAMQKKDYDLHKTAFEKTYTITFNEEKLNGIPA